MPNTHNMYTYECFKNKKTPFKKEFYRIKLLFCRRIKILNELSFQLRISIESRETKFKVNKQRQEIIGNINH